MTNIVQYMFNYKRFFNKKGHLLFPGTLCFPQYFAYSISAIFNNIYHAVHIKPDKDVENLCYAYLKFLPTIIKQLYGDKYKIEIDEIKILNTINTITRNDLINSEYILLESYLKDEKSIINYRKALLECSLKYYDFENVNELIDSLYDEQCCFNKVKDFDDDYPSSSHYILISDKRNNCNLNSDTLSLTTNFWGPFYWNIFHSIERTPKICS